MSKPHYAISWSPGRLADLDFADDIVMLSDSHDIIQHMTDDLNTNAAKVGLRTSCEKTKAMFLGEPPTTSISVGSNLLQSVENFQYLGTSLTLTLTYEQD